MFITQVIQDIELVELVKLYSPMRCLEMAGHLVVILGGRDFAWLLLRYPRTELLRVGRFILGKLS